MKQKVANETKEERFKRVASARANKILHYIRLLGNCSNRGIYSYTEDQVEYMFSTIENALKDNRFKFKFDKKEIKIEL